MHDADWLADQFERARVRLRAVAYRMLGSHPDAEDVVQEAWLRLSRSDADAIENLNGWPTTEASGHCLPPHHARPSCPSDLTHPIGHHRPAESPRARPLAQSALSRLRSKTDP